MASVTVTNSEDLTAAFDAAVGGDTILLAPGDYGQVYLDRRTFDTAVTIRSADPGDPAVFTEWATVRDVAGLQLSDITFEASGLIPDRGISRLFLRQVEDVVLTNVDIEGHITGDAEGLDPFDPAATRADPIAGYAYGIGLRIAGSSGVTVSGGTVSSVQTAVSVGDSTAVTIDGATVEAVREGINFYETTGLTISDSTFRDFAPWLPLGHPDADQRVHDHPDMIQYWGVNSTTGVHDITIRDNHFEMPAGTSTQTIFGHLDRAAAGVTATDFTVTGNTIINAHPHGISLGDVTGAIVADNVLLPNSTEVTKYWAPHITASGGRDIDVTGNTLVYHDGWGVWALTESERAAADIVLGQNTLLSDDPTSPGYWALWTPEPQAGLVVDGTEVAVGSFILQDEGVYELSPDGTTITLRENAWKDVRGAFDITSETVLSFEFSAETLGEIQGIGFASGYDPAPDSFFQLAGTQSPWGIQAHNDYTVGSGPRSYEIAVGDYLAGQSFDRLVFVADDDAAAAADSRFEGISLSNTSSPPEGLLIDGAYLPVLDGMVTRNDYGTYALSPDGAAITVTDNGWKVVEMPVTITSETVLSFEFSAETLGEIQGIGFASGYDPAPDSFFQLAGTQSPWGIQAHNDYTVGSGPRSYEIAVGDYLAGQSFDRLVFVADDDAAAAADSRFANIDLA